MQRSARRVFSGIQPSAVQVHWGNYLGAMRHFVRLSKECETIICIVNLHALTSVEDGEELRKNTRALAAAYIAIGLNPEEVTIFRQSDIPEVCELTWYLACRFPFGLLERAHSLKDKKARGMSVNSGLAFYPILMAADILLYRATHVPTGVDQKQHLEMTREIAHKFNSLYGDLFPIPQPLISEDTGMIPGIDGQKMSKSYDNYLGLFENPKAIKKKIMNIKTDSKTLDEPKDPYACNVFSLYKHFACEREVMEMEQKYRKGGYGYGHAKQELFRVAERELSPMRDKWEALMSKPDDLEDVLQIGAQKARRIAIPVIVEVRAKLGISNS